MGLSRKQIVMVVVLIFGTFVAVLNQTVVTPMLPTVMEEFSVDSSTAQWLTTGFTLVNAIMIPITAYLTDRYPLRRMFCVAMGIFVAGSLLAGWGPNFIVLLLGRMVQAAGAGILQPLVMTVLLRTFPVERRGTAMGIFGLVIAFAPAVGPTVAGLVIDSVGWHVLFFAIAALGVIVMIVAMFTIEPGEAANPNAYLDKLSVVLSCLGFGGLLYGLSAIGSDGLSVGAVVGLAVGIVALVFFFRRQLRLEEPMLNVRVLQNRRFTIATIIVMLVQASLMGATVLMPIYMQTDLGMSATQSGLVMLPAAIIMGVMGLVSGRIFDKTGPRWLGIIGLGIVTVTTIMFANLGTESTMAYLMTLYAVRMFGLSLVNMPINTWGMNALDDSQINHGTALNNTFRQVAGSLGTAIIVSVSSAAESSKAGVMTAVEASVYGIDCAFGVSAVFCLVALVLVILFVKDKPEEIERATTAEGMPITDLALVMKADAYTLPETATVLDAMRVITDKKIGGVTIVDEDGRLAGYITDGDIMRHLSKPDDVITDPMSMITQVVRENDRGKGFYGQVSDLMAMNVSVLTKSHPVSLTVHNDLKEACHVLGSYHLKKVPVVDDDNKLVGIVDRSDVIRYFMDVCIEQAEEAGDAEPSGTTKLAGAEA